MSRAALFCLFIYCLNLFLFWCQKLRIKIQRSFQRKFNAAFNVVSALHHCLLVFLFLADQIFYRSYVNRQHFRLRSFASLCSAVQYFWGRRSFQIRYAAHFFTWFGHDFPAGQFVCSQFPYRGNDTIFWIFPIVLCHAFCMWHWPIGKDLDLSFIWGHPHLHLVGLWMSVNQLHTSQLATPCWRDPIRSKQLSTIAIWLSVWTLSCHCPVKLST